MIKSHRKGLHLAQVVLLAQALSKVVIMIYIAHLVSSINNLSAFRIVGHIGDE